MSTEKSHKRLFSLGEKFMDFHTDDIVYGFMRTLSTAKPNKDKKFNEYLPIVKFATEKKVLADLCDCSTRHISNKVNKLLAKGLVQQEIIGNQLCYTFPIETKNPFRLIDKDVLEHLVYTRNPQCIRVYLYLLNKYLWKKGKNDNYIFTVQEIKEALGYNENTHTANKMINAILISFSAEGLIKYTKVIEMKKENGRIIPVQRYKLDYVIEKFGRKF